MTDLARKIADSSAIVAVMGLGYVGLPLLAAFSRAGFPVLGFDVDDRKIQALRKGENYLKQLGPTLVSDVVKTGRIKLNCRRIDSASGALTGVFGFSVPSSFEPR